MPTDCMCPGPCVYHPANFGQQIAARGGLPRDLAARIDAIERKPGSRCRVCGDTNTVPVDLCESHHPETELPLNDEALAWAMAGHQDDYSLTHRCDYNCAERIGVYYRRFGQ